MKRILAVILALFSFVLFATAAEFWNNKPYQKWSQAEATRMLTDSPWAKTTTVRTGTASASPRTRGGPQGVEDSRAEVMIFYTTSLRSSVPVREANARLAAFAQKYDKMDVAAKQAFDEKWNKYLENKFDVIVVAVNYDSNDPSLQRQLATFFQAQTLETMKPTTLLLLPDGRRLEPVGFAAGPRELQIAFPRPADLPPNSSFTIEFMHPGVTNQPTQKILTKFALKDMMFNGAPSY